MTQNTDYVPEGENGMDEDNYFEKPEYEVSVRNTFHADSHEDAVRQMIEWLQDNAASTGYRVGLAGSAAVEFIEGDEV